MTGERKTIWSLCVLVTLLSITCVLAFTTLRPKVIEKPKWLKPDVVRIHDSIPVKVPVIKKKIVTVPAEKVDTSAIISEYYTKNVYHDTLIQSPDMTIHIQDTVYNNRLLGRTVDYTASFKQKTHRIFIGSMVTKGGVSAFGGYGSRHWNIFGGYDFINKAPIVGASYNIGRW